MVSKLRDLFLLARQFALIDFLFHPMVLRVYSIKHCHIRAALVDEGYGSGPSKRAKQSFISGFKERGVN